MILTGKEIKRQIELGRINITDYDESKINPNSYNVSLNSKLLVYKEQVVLDMKKLNSTSEIEIPKEGIILRPGELYLGRTNEKTITNHYIPMIEGRSSVGRLGINIHATAGFGDVGFDGFWTLEISVIRPVRIYPNVDIGQVYFQRVEGEITLYSSNKYQFNNDVQASMMYKDFLKGSEK